MSVAFSFPVLTALAAGYLLGSIPFGLLLTRAAGLGDIRTIGSGNIGATNVLRTGNKGLAAATLLLDILKGVAAVLLAKAGVFGEIFGPMVAAAAAFGAFLGHLFPVWLGFKGGKGVATYIGVLAALYWPAAAVFCAVWLITAVATRYSSLSALTASVGAPLAVWALGWPEVAVLLVPITALLIYKHRPNIERLLAGQEPKIGAKA
jgi:glycerol-3-phosphate acyltransferase PlsY